MSKKQYQYSIYIEGVIPADDANQAKLIAQMGYSLNGRLLENPNKVLIGVADVTDKVEKKKQELLKKNGKVNDG